MTLQEFETILKSVCPETYDLVAPPDARRFIAWHRYGVQSGHGDDQHIYDLPKVQVDICMKSTTDDLADDVCAALNEHHLPYTVQDLCRYDPDYNALRTILQVVVI